MNKTLERGGTTDDEKAFGAAAATLYVASAPELPSALPRPFSAGPFAFVGEIAVWGPFLAAACIWHNTYVHKFSLTHLTRALSLSPSL